MAFLLRKYQLLTIILFLIWINTGRFLKIEKINDNIKNSNKLSKNEIDSLAFKRNLLVNPLVTYSNQNIYLNNIYNNNNPSNTSKSIRKINSKIVIYGDYVFISEIVNYKICIRALKKDDLASGIVASYIPIDDSYPQITEFESLSAHFILIGSYKLFTHKLKLIDINQKLYSLVSSIIQFDPTIETFTEISVLSGYRLLPNDRKVTKEGFFAFCYPFLINYTYNDLNPDSPQIIAAFLSILIKNTSMTVANEITITKIPANEDEQRSLINDKGVLYNKYNFYTTNKINGDLNLDETINFFNGKIFSLSSTTIFYIYRNLFSSSYPITIDEWDYSSNNENIEFSNKENFSISDNSEVYDSMFNYNATNNKKIVSILLKRKNNMDGKLYISLSKVEYYNKAKREIIDLVEFTDSTSYSNTYLGYFKTIGPWAFYCYYDTTTNNSSFCYSFLSNSNDPLDLSNWNSIAKIQTTDSTNNPVNWYVTDISFINLDSYGEVIPLIQFYEINGSDTFKLSKFIINTNTTPNNAFFLINKNEKTNETFLTLRCLANQVYDSNTSCFCSFCSAPNNFVENNECVSSCSSGEETKLGYCTETVLWDTYSDTLGEKQYTGNNQTFPCADKTAYINRECKACTDISLVLMGDLCIDACFDGYYDCDGVCYTEFCCNNNLLIENLTCVSECSIGSHADATNKYCIACESPTPYVNGISDDCTDSCESNEILNELIKKCVICNDYIYDDECILECPETTYPDEKNKTCVECSGPSNIFINLKEDGCVSNCSSGEYLSGIKCTKCDDYMYNNDCISECPETTYPDFISKICITCSGSDNLINSYNFGCVDSCNTGEYSNNVRCIVCNDYIYEDKCLSECPETTYPDKTNKICGICSGYNSLINSNNNGCVGSCETGEYSNNIRCIVCDSYTYNEECINECPKTTYPDETNKLCISCSGITPYINSNNNNCTDACNSNEIIDDDLNKCVICDKYIYEYNQSCISACPNTTVILDNKCIKCSESTPIISSDGSSCVSDCGENEKIDYIEVSTGKCTQINLCENKPFIYENQCVEKCPSKYTNDSNNNCLPCYEVEGKKYLYNDQCVSSCPFNYEYQTINYYLVCIKLEEEQSSDISKSEEVDSSSSTGEEKESCFNYCKQNLQCSCYGNFKGSKCALSEEEEKIINNEVNKLYDSLSSLSNPKDLVKKVSQIYSIVKNAPEIITNKYLNTLISVTTDLINKIKNGEIDASEDFYNILDNTLSIKFLSNSTIDISEVKADVDTLVNALLESKNLTSLTSGEESSSILFNGESFSVQVSNNGNKTNTQAMSDFLPIVDYSECEKELIAAGIVSEDTSLFAINICFDYTLSSNYDACSEDIKSASCSISSIIVDKYLNKVDTSSCSNIRVKFPTNNLVDKSVYDDLISQEIDIYDSNSNFFYDMCMRFAINGTDVSINSRRNLFNLSASCSAGCEYNGIDDNDYVICSCDALPEETLNLFKKQVFNSIITNNIILFKCFRQAFDLDYIIKSWGLWAFVCTTSIGILALIIDLIFYPHYHLINNLESVVYNDACLGIAPGDVGKADHVDRKSNFANNQHIIIEYNCNNILNNETTSTPEFTNKNINILTGSGSLNIKNISYNNNIRFKKSTIKGNILSKDIPNSKPGILDIKSKLSKLSNNNFNKDLIKINANNNITDIIDLEICEENNKRKISSITNKKGTENNGIKEFDNNFKYNKIDELPFIDLENQIQSKRGLKCGNIGFTPKYKKLSSNSLYSKNNSSVRSIPFKVGNKLNELNKNYEVRNELNNNNNFMDMEVENLENLEDSNQDYPESHSNRNLQDYTPRKNDYSDNNEVSKLSVIGNYTEKNDKIKKLNGAYSNSIPIKKNDAKSNIDESSSNDSVSINDEKRIIGNKIDNIKVYSVEDANNHSETISIKDIRTEADFKRLPVRMQIKIDDRTTCKFICHSLSYYHKTINVFLLKSIKNPMWIRIIVLIMEFSYLFAFNAIFFSMSTIDDIRARKSRSDSIGILYLIENQFMGILFPVVVSTFIGSIINLIIRVPEKYSQALNSFLITKDKDNIKAG